MAEVNINAKIEEGLKLIQPAKKTGQFGMYEKYIDDYIIATIKTYPDVDLGFVDRLGSVVIKNKNRRQARASGVRDDIAGDNLFVPYVFKEDYKIYDRVRMFSSADGKELSYEEANIVMPESIKPYVKYGKGKIEIDYEKITPEQAKIAIDNIKNDHLDKLSDEDYAALFEKFERIYNKEQSKGQDDFFENLKEMYKNSGRQLEGVKDEKNKKLMRLFFHELNHAVCLKQFVPVDKMGNPDLNKTVDYLKELDKDVTNYQLYHGGIRMLEYQVNTKDKDYITKYCWGTNYQHEGETEWLAHEQMNALFPGEFDYDKVNYSYFPLALYAQATNTLCGDILKKAYYGGNKEIEQNQFTGHYKLIRSAETDVAFIAGSLYHDNIEKGKHDEAFERLLKGAVATQNILFSVALFEGRKKQISEDQVNEVIGILTNMLSDRVWDPILCLFPKEKIIEYRNKFYPVLQESFDLEMDKHQTAQNEPDYEKFINNRVNYALKHGDALVEEAREVVKTKQEQQKKGEKPKVRYGVAIKDGKEIKGVLVESEGPQESDKAHSM